MAASGGKPDYGGEGRVPFMPEQRRKAPMEAAVPKHTVEICRGPGPGIRW